MFTVYSKPGCPYCTKVKRVLELAEVKHIVYTLDVDYDKQEFYSKFGEGSTFPQVTVSDTNLGGCVDTVKYLREHKYL
tara:strand:- start:1513 stop:1746 length:234 start_codon:yes stop_codon:yes gene_type:complete